MQGTVVMPAVLAASFEAPECDDPAGGAAASVGFTGATLTRLVPAPGPAIPAPGGFPPEVPPGGVPAPGVPAGLPPLPPSSVPPPPDPNSVPPPDPPVAAVRRLLRPQHPLAPRARGHYRRPPPRRLLRPQPRAHPQSQNQRYGSHTASFFRPEGDPGPGTVRRQRTRK